MVSVNKGASPLRTGAPPHPAHSCSSNPSDRCATLTTCTRTRARRPQPPAPLTSTQCSGRHPSLAWGGSWTRQAIDATIMPTCRPYPGPRVPHRTPWNLHERHFLPAQSRTPRIANRSYHHPLGCGCVSRERVYNTRANTGQHSRLLSIHGQLGGLLTSLVQDLI